MKILNNQCRIDLLGDIDITELYAIFLIWNYQRPVRYGKTVEYNNNNNLIIVLLFQDCSSTNLCNLKNIYI